MSRPGRSNPQCNQSQVDGKQGECFKWQFAVPAIVPEGQSGDQFFRRFYAEAGRQVEHAFNGVMQKMSTNERGRLTRMGEDEIGQQLAGACVTCLGCHIGITGCIHKGIFIGDVGWARHCFIQAGLPGCPEFPGQPGQQAKGQAKNEQGEGRFEHLRPLPKSEHANQQNERGDE
ncbi:MAG: hypothetical protein ACUVRJ_10885 [Candidatus Villigracilaceae bacterium]